MPIPYSCIGDINTCSPQIRDYLLLRNLQVDAVVQNAYYNVMLHSNDVIGMPVDITAQEFISDPVSGHIQSSIEITNVANQKRAEAFNNDLYADAIIQNGYYNTFLNANDALGQFVDTESQQFITNGTIHTQSSIEIDNVATQRRTVLLAQNLILDTVANSPYLLSTLNSLDAIGSQVQVGISPTLAQVGQNPNAIESPSTDIRREEAMNSNIYQSGQPWSYTDINENFTLPMTQSDLIDASGNIVPLPQYTHPLTYPKTGVDLVSNLSNAGNYLRDSLMGKNKYTFNNETTVDVGSRVPGDVANQTTEYLDDKHKLNVGGYDTQPADIIGSLLTGSLGFSQNGLVTNFDLRSTLAGRTLGTIGIINDTELGRIGAQQLAFALANNAAFNLQQETIGHVNLNPLSLLTGHDLIIPNYDITVSETSLGKALDFTSKLMGFQAPASGMDADSWTYAPTLGSTQTQIRSENELIKNTGKGQVIALFANLDINMYRPAYSDKRLEKDGTNGNIYNYPDSVASDNPFGSFYLMTNETIDGQPVVESQQEYQVWPDYKRGSDKSPIGTTMPVSAYEAPNPYKNKSSILYKTYELFKSGKIDTMVNSHSKIANDAYDQIQTGGRVNNCGDLTISKGSAIQGEDGRFCRTWSTLKQYNRVGDLQKHRGLDVGTVHRNNRHLSVLDDNGFARVSPYYGDSNDGNLNMKRFMLSIENLAWADDYYNLPNSEKGPGDPLNPAMKGRIMWFPPYDINFTDSTSVNWETTTFIGRSEPIYTYSNTERTGTLQFKVIADHPSMLNDLRFTSEKYQIEDIMAGCKTLPPSIKMRLTNAELSAMEVKQATEGQNKISNLSYNQLITVYFPNAVYSVSDLTWSSIYETANGVKTFKEESPYGQHNIPYPTSYMLNDTGEYSWHNLLINDETFKKILNSCKNGALSVNIKGYASSSGEVNNENLAKDRANSLRTFLIDKFKKANILDAEKRVKIVKTGVITVPVIPKNGMSEEQYYIAQVITKEDIMARKVDLYFYYDPSLDGALTPDIIDDEFLTEDLNMSLRKSKYIDEAEYFFKLQDINKYVYDDIRQKLRWFHPAFHSTTPEGLNSRLTFLQQCGRQGSTGENSSNPENLAFGRPPVCILRIGDFYHTKIVIDSINFTYEPLVWDLNPEGIGVQPMLATVDLNFKFVGGSSLQGPINRLQNAVSFNFFANNEVYSERPDYIENGKLKEGYKHGTNRQWDSNVNTDRTDIYGNMTKAKPRSINQIEGKKNEDIIINPMASTSGITVDFNFWYTTAGSSSEIRVEFKINDDNYTELPPGRFKFYIFNGTTTDIGTDVLYFEGDFDEPHTESDKIVYYLDGKTISKGNHAIKVKYVAPEGTGYQKTEVSTMLNVKLLSSTNECGGKMTIVKTS
jgi:hypothetical protein